MKLIIKISSICLITGIIIMSCTPKNDNLIEEYYPDGNIKTRMEVKNDKRNGLTQNYDEHGRLESSAELVDDMYQGWMTNYNTKTGKVTNKSYYENDTQNGPAYQYYVTGELYREETYKKGRIDSIVKTYWTNGQLQAEVYFRMGDPAIGLKEWDKQGNPIKQPQIIIEKINHLETTSSIELKIYLSDNSTDIDFYQGELEDGKYLGSGNMKLDTDRGVATIQYYVPKRATIKKVISIICRTRSELGNTLVLQKDFKLIANN